MSPRDDQPDGGGDAGPGATASAAVVALDERRLLPMVRRGDVGAFAELVQRYRAPVYGYVSRCGVPTGARDDVFQAVFIKVHAAAATYQPDRPLRPWLFTIVANEVRTWFRRRRVELLVFPERAEQTPTAEPTSPAADPGAENEARELAGYLQQQLEVLELPLREALCLCAIEGLSAQEAARVLDTSPATVRVHLHRARLELARALARRRARAAREERR